MMTDEQVIKGLECCTGGSTSEGCHGCPYFKKGLWCIKHLIRDVLANFKRQKSENERLSVENERFKHKISILQKLLDKAEERIANARADAVMEFSERVLALFPCDKKHTEISRATIEQIVREMTEGEQ